jgi:hypothetical protein
MIVLCAVTSGDYLSGHGRVRRRRVAGPVEASSTGTCSYRLARPARCQPTFNHFGPGYASLIASSGSGRATLRFGTE